MDTTLKLEDVSMTIVANVEQRCQCGFTHGYLTNKVFQCFEASYQAVTYRATLYGTINVTSLELIALIDQWVSGGTTIPVQNILIRVDSSCTAKISSNNDDECIMSSSRFITSTDSKGVILGSATTAGVLLLAVITFITLMSVCFGIKKHKSLKQTTTRYIYPSYM